MRRSARSLAPMMPLMAVIMLIGGQYIDDSDIVLRAIGMLFVAGGALVLCGIALAWWRERVRSSD